LSQIRFGSTINIVGPLLNPTMPAYKVMGVPSSDMIDIEVATLRELGFKRAFVMHGLEDETGKGMDELSTIGTSHIAELRADGSIARTQIIHEALGLRRARFEDVASSRDVNESAIAILRVILGQDTGPRSDIICLNAAPVLYVMGKVENLTDGIAMARSAVSKGSAANKLREWVTWQNAKPEDGLPILERMIAQAS
jgi:anthranilate phosphoribosyltransferase